MEEAYRFDDATDDSSPLFDTVQNEPTSDQSTPSPATSTGKRNMAQDIGTNDVDVGIHAPNERCKDTVRRDGEADTDEHRVNDHVNGDEETKQPHEENEKETGAVLEDNVTGNNGSEKRSLESDDDYSRHRHGDKKSTDLPPVDTPTKSQTPRRVTRSHSRLDADEVDSGNTSDEPTWTAAQLELLADAMVSRQTLDTQVLSRELRRLTRSSPSGVTTANAPNTTRYVRHVIDTIRMTKQAIANLVSSSRPKSIDVENAQHAGEKNKKCKHSTELNDTDGVKENKHGAEDNISIGNAMIELGQKTSVSEDVSCDEVRAFMAADVLRFREGVPIPVAKAAVHKRRAGDAALRLRKVWRAAFDARATAEASVADAAVQLTSTQATHSAIRAARKGLKIELEKVQQFTADTEASHRNEKQVYASLLGINSAMVSPAASPAVSASLAASASPSSTPSFLSASAEEQVEKTDDSIEILLPPRATGMKRKAKDEKGNERKKVKVACRKREMEVLRSKIRQMEAESGEYQRTAQAVSVECDLMIEQKESLQREVHRLKGKYLDKH